MNSINKDVCKSVNTRELQENHTVTPKNVISGACKNKPKNTQQQWEHFQLANPVQHSRQIENPINKLVGELAHTLPSYKRHSVGLRPISSPSPTVLSRMSWFLTHCSTMVFAKGSTRIVDPGPDLRMRRLWILRRNEYDVIVTWRHRWRHQSTRHRHFHIGSPLDTNL